MSAVTTGEGTTAHRLVRRALGALLLGATAVLGHAADSGDALLLHGAASPGSSAAPVAEAAGSPGSSGCIARARSNPDHHLLDLRSKLRVSTRVRFDCPAPVKPLHTVLALDAGAPHPEGTAPWLVSGLSGMAAGLRLDANPFARFGALSFDVYPEPLCDLAEAADGPELQRCLARAGAAVEREQVDNVAIGAAIVEATRQLVRARDLHRAPIEAPEERILVVFGAEAVDASSRTGAVCAAAADAVGAARAVGISTELVCVSGACSSSCMRSAVDDARYIAARSRAGWDMVADSLATDAWSTELRVRRLSITERLGDGFWYQRGSADPIAAYNPHSHALEWHLDPDGRPTLSMAYAMAPARTGRMLIREATLGGVGTFLDTRGGTGVLHLGNREVGVFDGRLPRIFMPAVRRSPCSVCVRPDGATGPAHP